MQTMIRITRHKQRISKLLAFDPLKTPELMEEFTEHWYTSRNILPILVWWNAEVVDLFKQSEVGSLTRGLLYYSRKRAYHASTTKVKFLQAQSQTPFPPEKPAEKDTEMLTTPWCFPDDEVKMDAGELDRHDKWSPIIPYRRPCKQ